MLRIRMNKIPKTFYSAFRDNNVLIEKQCSRIQSDTGRFILFCFIIISFSFTGCQSSTSSRDSDSIMSFTVNPNNDKISFPLSEIAEKVDSIELETTDNSLIYREITQVAIMNDHYIIKDHSPGVLFFDLQGKFVRRIGKRGQGPGELYFTTAVQFNIQNENIWFWQFDKFTVFDVNGNPVEDKKKERQSYSEDKVYYMNDSIFLIQDLTKKDSATGWYNQEMYFKIFAYSNGNIYDNVLDSLLIKRFELKPTHTSDIRTIFQHQGQVYMFYPDRDCYIYVIKNGQFVQFARLDLQSTMRELTVTDRYVLAIHGALINTSNPAIITPEVAAALRSNGSGNAIKDYSYHVYDRRTGKNIDSYHGFIDDIHHSKEVIPIKFMDGCERFFYTQEGKWSEELNTELNPTLYIGTFKK